MKEIPKGMVPYRSNVIKGLRYALIALIASLVPLLVYPALLSRHVPLASFVLVVFLLVLGVFAILVYECFRRRDGIRSRLREGVKFIDWHLEETLAVSRLAIKEGGITYIPKVVRENLGFPVLWSRWRQTPNGIEFAIYDHIGGNAFEALADVITRQLPEDLECRHSGSFDSKARYVITFHNPKIPSIEADL